LVPDPGIRKGRERLCDKHNALLISMSTKLVSAEQVIYMLYEMLMLRPCIFDHRLSLGRWFSNCAMLTTKRK